MRRRTLSAAALTCAFLLLLGARAASQAGPARADTPAPATARELRIERTLACPQCTDLPLDVCENSICTDMRAIIRQQIAVGRSDAQIRQYFVQRYGSRVLLAPPKSRANLLAWLMPFAGLLLGAIAVYAFVRGARHASPAATTPSLPDAALNPYRARVEQEVQQYE